MKFARELQGVLIAVIFGCSNAHPASIPKTEKEVVCFVYHRVGDSRYPTTNITVDDFEAHLNYLVKNGFHVVTLSEALTYIDSDQPERKTAVITVDDGYKSFFKYGLPLLKKYDLPATLFVNTETVGAGDYMDWSQLQLAIKAGLELGNHTHSHQYFLNLPDAAREQILSEEIEKSQNLIKEHLGVIPTLFSFPYGEFDNKMKEVVREAGFRAAAAQNSGVLSTDGDRFIIPRFPMSESYSALTKFIEKANAHRLAVDRVNDDPVVSGNLKPKLNLTVTKEGLDFTQLQCFIQGTTCHYQVIAESDKSVTMSITPEQPLTRRRTICTITVRGRKGGWYWYSHLWVNPLKK